MLETVDICGLYILHIKTRKPRLKTHFTDAISPCELKEDVE